MLNTYIYNTDNRHYIWNTTFLHKVYLNILNFQKRIYKASKICNTSQIHSLQKQLLSRYDIKVLAINHTLINVEQYYCIYKKIQYIFTKEQKSLFLKKLLNKNIFFLKQSTACNITQLIEEKIKQYITYLILKPEWLPRLELMFNFDRDIVQKIILFFKHNIRHKIQSVCMAGGPTSTYCKYIDQDYLIDKLNTLPDIRIKIKNWLAMQHFIEHRSIYRSFYVKHIEWHDHLWKLLQRISYTGMEWYIYSKTHLNYCFIDNLILYNIKGYIYYFTYYQVEYIYTLSSCFLTSIRYNLYPKVCIQNKSKSSYLKFADIYIIIKNRHHEYKMMLMPSLESIKNLLYSIRCLLYHKNRFNYWRCNSYLSTVNVRKLIRENLLHWHNHYKNILSIHLIKHVNEKVNQIIYRWQLKK